jgi:hypothetical protein
MSTQDYLILNLSDPIPIEELNPDDGNFHYIPLTNKDKIKR